MKKNITLFAIWVPCSLAILSYAQESSENEVFELSPFEVDASQDTGYRAANTLSGTRFNSSLRDTSASVSVWTQEFLDDVGLTEINELIDYSLSTVLDTNDQDGPDGGANVYLNATTQTVRIRTRGVEASRGVDYFKSITPDDSYRIGRYDDSRGPNGVLFGVSLAGGLINQSSLVANTQRDSARIQYSFGSDDRNRANFRYNKVLLENKLALTLAGVHQENGGWRLNDFQDKDRIFGTATWKANDRITIRGNYEEGFENRSNAPPFTPSDQVLPWWDNLQANGVEAVTFAPTNRNATAEQQVVGVTGRNANFNASNNRFVWIENDGGTFFNAAGTLLTDGYDNDNVRGPNGELPQQGDGRYIRINDPSFIPYEVTGSGSSVYRNQDFTNYSFTSDIKLTENWFLNINHGVQEVNLAAYQTTGSQPDLRGDPNTTLGSTRGGGFANPNPPPNPYAGLLYMEGAYRRDKNIGEYKESRISTSYSLDTERLGTHQIAIAASRADEYARRGNTNLSLAGNPSGSAFFQNNNNQIRVRHYITDVNDKSQFRIGDWRTVPTSITTDRFTGVPTTYGVVWAESAPGNINYLVNQVTDSKMGVAQSKFLNGRLVATFGYREDEAEIDRHGHYIDPIVGHLPDPDDVISTTLFDGTTRTAGVVFHLTENFSLLANTATNIGIPDFRRTVFPNGTTSPPAQGDGDDFGIDFSLAQNKIHGRLVYYTTSAIQEVIGGSQAAGEKSLVYEALGNALTTGTGAPYTVEQWAALEPELDPSVNGRFRDNVSDGYELSVTANFTKNWRMTLNASKTDRIVSNSFSKAIEWYGLIKGDDGLLVQGATPEAIIDRSAYTSDGVISRWFEFENQLPDGVTLETLSTSADGETVATQIFNVVDDINDQIQIDEKRWGLRPYRFNLFTTYDFDEGRLKGFSVGGGLRWQSSNIIGEENGVEFEGEEKIDTDFLVKYKMKLKDKGNLTLQMNVTNVFDDTGILPVRLAGNGDLGYQVPGDRGIAYARFDLKVPRALRFTATYDF